MTTTFTDISGDIYEAVDYQDVIEVTRDWGDDQQTTLSFYTADAPAIIKLIEQAADLTAKAGVPN